MSLYFFHLRDGADVLLDPDGRQLTSAEAVSDATLLEARSIISHEALSGQIKLDQHIDVEDEFRNIIHTLHFVDAVEIVQPQP